MTCHSRGKKKQTNTSTINNIIFYSRHVTVSQHAQYTAIINFIIFTCASPTVTEQRGLIDGISILWQFIKFPGAPIGVAKKASFFFPALQLYSMRPVNRLFFFSQQLLDGLPLKFGTHNHGAQRMNLSARLTFLVQREMSQQQFPCTFGADMNRLWGLLV